MPFSAAEEIWEDLRKPDVVFSVSGTTGFVDAVGFLGEDITMNFILNSAVEPITPAQFLAVFKDAIQVGGVS